MCKPLMLGFIAFSPTYRDWSSLNVPLRRARRAAPRVLTKRYALLGDSHRLERKYARVFCSGRDITALERIAYIVKLVRILYRQIWRPFRFVFEKLDIHLGNVLAFVHEFDSMALIHLCLFAW